jgi:large subunit ribosomal protein L15
VAINAYEGGQMPLYQRLPKRGFNKPNRKEFAVVNLGLIQKFVEAGKLDAKAEITEDALSPRASCAASSTASGFWPRAR